MQGCCKVVCTTWKLLTSKHTFGPWAILCGLLSICSKQKGQNNIQEVRNPLRSSTVGKSISSNMHWKIIASLSRLYIVDNWPLPVHWLDTLQPLFLVWCELEITNYWWVLITAMSAFEISSRLQLSALHYPTNVCYSDDCYLTQICELAPTHLRAINSPGSIQSVWVAPNIQPKTPVVHKAGNQACIHACRHSHTSGCKHLHNNASLKFTKWHHHTVSTEFSVPFLHYWAPTHILNLKYTKPRHRRITRAHQERTLVDSRHTHIQHLVSSGS